MVTVVFVPVSASIETPGDPPLKATEAAPAAAAATPESSDKQYKKVSL